jgi:hypothetical protein
LLCTCIYICFSFVSGTGLDSGLLFFCFACNVRRARG